MLLAWLYVHSKSLAVQESCARLANSYTYSRLRSVIRNRHISKEYSFREVHLCPRSAALYGLKQACHDEGTLWLFALPRPQACCRLMEAATRTSLKMRPARPTPHRKWQLTLPHILTSCIREAKLDVYFQQQGFNGTACTAVAIGKPGKEPSRWWTANVRRECGR